MQRGHFGGQRRLIADPRGPRPCPTGLGGGVIAEGEGKIAVNSVSSWSEVHSHRSAAAGKRDAITRCVRGRVSVVREGFRLAIDACSPSDVRLARKINFWKGIFYPTNLLELGSWWALPSAGWESLSLTKDGEDAHT